MKDNDDENERDNQNDNVTFIERFVHFLPQVS